jgi:opacity protein-like surface antigen
MTIQKKRSVFFLVIWIVIISRPLSAGKLTFGAKISGGLGYLSGSDINSYYQTLNEWDDYHKNPVTGRLLAVHLGSDFQAEFFLGFGPNLGITLGVGRLGVSRESVLTRGSGTDQSKETYKPGMSATVITLGGFYALPLTRTLMLNANAGMAYYFGRIKFSYSDVDNDSSYVQTWESSKSVFGFQAGAGLEYAILPKLSLVVEALARFAALEDLSGPYHYTSKGPTWSTEYNATHTAWLVNYKNDPTTTNSWILLLTTGTDDPNNYPEIYSHVRKASFSLSGISLRLGAKYKF